MFKKSWYKMMVFMSERMIACDKAGFLISCQQDNRLGLVNWVRLKMHLLSCHRCRKYAIQIEQLEGRLTEYRLYSLQEPCKHHLSDEACSKIRQVISKEMSAK